MLLLQSTGLVLKRIELNGEAFNLDDNSITTSSPLLETYSYLAVLQTDQGP
jgi:hypothetical protein